MPTNEKQLRAELQKALDFIFEADLWREWEAFQQVRYETADDAQAVEFAEPPAHDWDMWPHGRRRR